MTVQNQRTYDDKYYPDERVMISIFIRLDNREVSYDRKVYSLFEFLGDLGGLYQSLFVIGFILVTYFVERIFVSSILRQIYQIKKLDGEEPGKPDKIEAKTKGGHKRTPSGTLITPTSIPTPVVNTTQSFIEGPANTNARRKYTQELTASGLNSPDRKQNRRDDANWNEPPTAKN